MQFGAIVLPRIHKFPVLTSYIHAHTCVCTHMCRHTDKLYALKNKNKVLFIVVLLNVKYLEINLINKL